MRRLILCVMMLLWPGSGLTQDSGQRERLVAIMAMDCGIGETAVRFRLTVKQAPASARTVFREILRNGLPDSIQSRALTDATNRYDRYSDWANDNPDKPHAKAFLAGPGRQAFIDQAIADLTVTYQSNALRGLGLAGNVSDRATIQTAMSKQPRLSRISRSALAEMTRRSR